MLTKRQASLKRTFEFIGKIFMIFLLIMVSLYLVKTIQEKYKNAPNDCTETVTDEFGVGLRPNMNGKITFGFGSEGINLLDVFSFED